MIHFPRYDGSGGFSHVNHPGRVNHFLPANKPWNLLASGPLAEDLTVTYYDGLEKLKVLKTYGGNPYTVQLEGLDPGLHVIHAVTRYDGKEEISHAHPIFFCE